ncbi:MAG TPA: hypothetical protein DCM71_08100, partial [Runella sp.]|nr:hypothetical protein [Runella sp.]
DKIFKENIEAVIRSIVKNVPHGRPVGITAISLEELPDDVQHTKFYIMDNIAKYIDEEKDVAYLIGFDKGEEKIVSNLLKKLNYNIEQIADIAGVSVEFVSKVKQQLLSAK